MANTAKYIGSAVSPAVPVLKEYAVASGVTVYDGDFVYLASGRVTSASIAGVTLLGQVVGQNSAAVSTHTESGTAVGDANGTVKVLVNVEPNAKFTMLNDNIGTTFAAAHIGTCFDLIGNAGSQLIDTSTTGTTGQFECIGYGVNGDVTYGTFITNEHKYKVNA